MPEEDLGGDQPTPDAPDAGGAEQQPAEPPAVDWESDDNPYKQRYGDLRPQYDRYHNTVAQLENPETQAEILRRFGIELAEEESDDEPFDADEPMTRAEFQEFLAEQRAQQHAALSEEQALETDASAISSQIEEIEKQHGPLSEDEIALLLPAAIQNRDDQGLPRFKDAFERYDSGVQGRHQAYANSKKATAIGLGAAGDRKIDPSDPDALDELAAAEAQAMLEED